MKWILPVFLLLIGIFWFTAKDRSISAMIESIVSDFRSKGPGPFEIESFRSGGHSGGHSGGRSGGRSGGHYGNYGGNYGGSWWPWYWPWYNYPVELIYPVDPIPYPIEYQPTYHLNAY
jgi:hypothetical protein